MHDFADINFLNELLQEEVRNSWNDVLFIDILHRHWEQFRKREREVADAVGDDAPDSDGHLWIKLPGLFLGGDYGQPMTVENLPANMRIRNGIVEYKKDEEITEETNAIIKVKCQACGEVRTRKVRRSEAASSSAE